MSSFDPGTIFKKRYDNFIGGKWVPPVKGQYFENITPVTGKAFCEVARSSAEDIELALDAAHAAKDAWGQSSATARGSLGVKSSIVAIGDSRIRGVHRMPGLLAIALAEP